MEWSTFLTKWNNGKHLSALQAARLLIDLKHACVVLENGQYLYIANNSIFISSLQLFNDRIYYTNEQSIIYPTFQTRIENGEHIPSGRPGSDNGPLISQSVLGTHTVTLEHFYTYVSVCSKQRILNFFTAINLQPPNTPPPHHIKKINTTFTIENTDNDDDDDENKR